MKSQPASHRKCQPVGVRWTSLFGHFVSPEKADRGLCLHWNDHLVQKDVNGGPAEMLNPISVMAILSGKLLKGPKKRIANLSDFLSQKVIVMRVVLVQVILGNLHRLGRRAIREQALLKKMQQHAAGEWPGINAGHCMQLIHENNRLGIVNGTNLGI